MLPTYKKGNYNAAQANAIATLMKDCGGAVSMQYSASGSGAYASDACIALRNNFKYHDGLKLYTRSFYTLDEWMDLIYRELNDECPILYGGATKMAQVMSLYSMDMTRTAWYTSIGDGTEPTMDTST